MLLVYCILSRPSNICQAEALPVDSPDSSGIVAAVSFAASFGHADPSPAQLFFPALSAAAAGICWADTGAHPCYASQACCLPGGMSLPAMKTEISRLNLNSSACLLVMLYAFYTYIQKSGAPKVNSVSCLIGAIAAAHRPFISLGGRLPLLHGSNLELPRQAAAVAVQICHLRK